MNIFYEPVNLKQWPMFDVVKSIGHEEPFLATKSMNIGDIVLLHVGQQDKRYHSGVYAVGKVISPPAIIEDRPDDYCNHKLSVWVKIEKINYSEPYITHAECTEIINQFRTVHKIDEKHYPVIQKLLER